WQVYLDEKAILGRFMKGESLPDDLLWQRSPAFWRSVDKNAPAGRPDGLQRPVLVLHGNKDVQVGSKDMDAWRKLLQGRRDVVFREYPQLDHSFRADGGTDPKRGAIAAEVVKDLGKWVGALEP